MFLQVAIKQFRGNTLLGMWYHLC